MHRQCFLISICLSLSVYLISLCTKHYSSIRDVAANSSRWSRSGGNQAMLEKSVRVPPMGPAPRWASLNKENYQKTLPKVKESLSFAQTREKSGYKEMNLFTQSKNKSCCLELYFISITDKRQLGCWALGSGKGYRSCEPVIFYSVMHYLRTMYNKVGILPKTRQTGHCPPGAYSLVRIFPP